MDKVYTVIRYKSQYRFDGIQQRVGLFTKLTVIGNIYKSNLIIFIVKANDTFSVN